MPRPVTEFPSLPHHSVLCFQAQRPPGCSHFPPNVPRRGTGIKRTMRIELCPLRRVLWQTGDSVNNRPALKLMRNETRTILIAVTALMIVLVSTVVVLLLTTGAGSIGAQNDHARPSRPATPEQVAVFPMPDQVQNALQDVKRLGYTGHFVSPGKAIDNIKCTFIRHPSLDSYGFVLYIEDLRSGTMTSGADDSYTGNKPSGQSTIPPFEFAIAAGKPYSYMGGLVGASKNGKKIELKGDAAKRFLESGPTDEEIDQILRGLGLPSVPK